MGTGKKHLVYLDEETVNKARTLGAGNLSAGIRLAVKYYDEKAAMVEASIDHLQQIVEETVRKYPDKHPDFVRRLVQTALAVEEPIIAVTRKYLDGDTTAEISERMKEAYEQAVRQKEPTNAREFYEKLVTG